MPTKFPIRYWMDHMTFDDRLKPYAVYKLPMHNYSMLSDQEKLDLFSRTLGLYMTVERDFKILSLCREILPSNYEKSMIEEKSQDKRLPEIFKQEYQEHIDSVKKELAIINSWQRELYLVLPLDKSNVFQKILKKKNIKEGLNEAKEALFETFLGQEPAIDNVTLEKVMRDEVDVYEYVRSTIGGERATSLDIQWILNRMSTRSIQQRKLHENWTPPSIAAVRGGNSVAIRPVKNTIMSMFYSYEVDDTPFDYMIIKHADTGEKSYQSFVQFADYPEDVYMPGSEVYYALDRMGFPIDICIEVKYSAAADASRKLYGKNLELQEQSRQYSESMTGAPLELRDAHSRMKLLEDKLDRKMPLLSVNTTLALSSTNEVELRQMRSSLIDNLKGYYAVCAPSKQRESYMQFMPIMTYGLDIYSIPMDPGFLASGMVDATVDIGEKVGFYLGIVMSGNRQPMLINPPLAQATNKTATTAILGNLGGGKSMLNKTLIYYMLLWGAKVVAIDPKDENRCFKAIPSIAKRMRQIDIATSDKTGINPYRIAPDDINSASIAVDFLSIILNANEVSSNSESRRIAINKAVALVMDQEHSHRNMDYTIRAFYHLAYGEGVNLPPEIRKEAELCYILLQDQREMAVSRVVFDTAAETLDINNLEDQFVNFNIAQLPLPTEQELLNLGQNGRLTPMKLLGTAIMYLIAQFARYATLSGSKRVYKVLSLDEAWRLSSTPQGADLIMEIVRMGRTYNIMPIIATQSAADLLDEKIRNNIGMVFMFKNKDENEIRNCAKLLGIKEVSESFISDVRALKSGTCYFRDLYDRVSKITIRPQPTSLLKTFDTSPEGAAAMEEGVSA